MTLFGHDAIRWARKRRGATLTICGLAQIQLPAEPGDGFRLRAKDLPLPKSAFSSTSGRPDYIALPEEAAAYLNREHAKLEWVTVDTSQFRTPEDIEALKHEYAGCNDAVFIVGKAELRHENGQPVDETLQRVKQYLRERQMYAYKLIRAGANCQMEPL